MTLPVGTLSPVGLTVKAKGLDSNGDYYESTDPLSLSFTSPTGLDVADEGAVSPEELVSSFAISETESYQSVFASMSDEVLVNTTTNNIQTDSTMVQLNNGGFVVIWESYDGSNNGVYTQIFNANGSQISGEILVNSTLSNNQVDASVTVLNSGEFVVVWESVSQDGDSLGVYAQRFNSSGIPQGSEFIVNTTTANAQENPDIIALSNGGFVVSWMSYDGSDYEIHTRLFNATGAATSAEITVNTYMPSDQSNASITALNSGDFVVVWESQGQDGSNLGIYAQRFNLSGTPQGSEFIVNTTTTNAQEDPDVIALSNGGFAVIWESYGATNEYEIHTRLFNSTGTATSSEIVVNSTLTNNQANASVTLLSKSTIDDDFRTCCCPS